MVKKDIATKSKEIALRGHPKSKIIHTMRGTRANEVYINTLKWKAEAG